MGRPRRQLYPTIVLTANNKLFELVEFRDPEALVGLAKKRIQYLLTDVRWRLPEEMLQAAYLQGIADASYSVDTNDP